jgi:hypothetical protein
MVIEPVRRPSEIRVQILSLFKLVNFQVLVFD